ncbi:proteasome activator pa28 [Phakopsora pachyrhizi]|nr:proteasome activator pa28 [Phakopsora pachyrhizi]
MTSGTLWSETSDKDVRSKLRTWTEQLEVRGRDAIQVKLPAKILELNEILENIDDPPIPTTELQVVNTTNDHEGAAEQAGGRKKRKVANGKETGAPAASGASEQAGVRNPGHVECNPRVMAHYTFLRKHWEQLINITNDIKIHINLLVPKIEDGDTFGVQVQEECLSEISRAQDSGYNLLEAQLKHHTNRGKLASKLIKYPNVEDYQIALQEHDRKSIYLCRQHIIDLRNIYTLLTDLLHKNIVKITKPKGANSDGM